MRRFQADPSGLFHSAECRANLTRPINLIAPFSYSCSVAKNKSQQCPFFTNCGMAHKFPNLFPSKLFRIWIFSRNVFFENIVHSVCVSMNSKTKVSMIRLTAGPIHYKQPDVKISMDLSCVFYVINITVSIMIRLFKVK